MPPALSLPVQHADLLYDLQHDLIEENVLALTAEWYTRSLPDILQVVEAKEAGAAGVLGTIANVSGPRGAPVLSSYAAAIGLDCPVEVSLRLHSNG